mgnify:CR=1 FL=1
MDFEFTVVAHRGKQVGFGELPDKSIALDGYVQGPQIDSERQRYSFDHHADCIRHVTSATCQQVFDALMLGLDPSGFTVFINDVDGDVVLSVWLLAQAEQLKEVSFREKVRQLVEVVGKIDAFGSSYPISDPDLSLAFFGGAIGFTLHAHKDSDQADDLLVALMHCLPRIDEVVSGQLRSGIGVIEEGLQIHATGTGGWVMASGGGTNQLYRRGITRAVAFKELPDGTYYYTVVKKSDFVPNFPVGPGDEPGTILHALAVRESGWGGSTTIGGSPKHADRSGSRLKPAEVFEIVESVIKGG